MHHKQGYSDEEKVEFMQVLEDLIAHISREREEIIMK